LGGHPLRGRAGKLFKHVATMFKDAQIETPALVNDYTVLLRKHLLPMSEYCLKASADTYKELIAIFMARVLHQGDEVQEVARSLGTLADLLHHCPVDLRPGELHELVQLLQQLCDDCLASTEGNAMPSARVVEPFMAACNALLLNFGADAAHSLPPLADSVTKLLMRVWANTQAMPKLKDECCLTARVLLKLGILSDTPGALKNILTAVTAEAIRRANDMERTNREERTGRGGASSLIANVRTAGKMLLELLAELWAHRLSGEPGWVTDSSDDDDGTLPRKRARYSDSSDLLDKVVNDHDAAMLPVLAILLHRYPGMLPRHAHARTVRMLARVMADGLRPVPLGTAVTRSLWALRCLRSLAAAEKRADSASDGGAASPHTEEDEDDDTVDPTTVAHQGGDGDAQASACEPTPWNDALQLMWAFLDTLKDGSGLAPEVLHTVAALILHDRAPPPRVPSAVLTSVLLKKGTFSTRLALPAAATLFSCPLHGVVPSLDPPELVLRSRAVAWALESLEPQKNEPVAMMGPRTKEEPPDAVGTAAIGLSLCLGLKPHPDAFACLPSWCEDDSTDAALALLARGPSTRGSAESPGTFHHGGETRVVTRLTPQNACHMLKSMGETLVTRMAAAHEAAQAVALVAVACHVHTRASQCLPDALPDIWALPNGAVFDASRHALQVAQCALSAALHPRLLFTARLATACADCGNLVTRSAALDESIIQLIESMRLAIHAGLTAVQQEAQNMEADRDMLFDDEDMKFGDAMPAGPTQRVDGTQYPGGTQAVRGGAGGGGDSPLEVGMTAIAALGLLRPVEASEVLRSFLDQGPVDLPLVVTDAAMASLCALQDAPEEAHIAAVDVLTAALVAISKEGANIADAGRAPRLLHLVSLLAATALRGTSSAAGGSGVTPMDATPASGAPRTLRSALVSLTDLVFGGATDADTEQQFENLRRCGMQTGLALANAVCALLSPVNQDRAIVTTAGRLLGDARYAVRRAMAPLFGGSVTRFPTSQHPEIFNFARSYMAGVPDTVGAAYSESAPAQEETTVLQLAELVLHSPSVEQDALFCLLELVESFPVHQPLVLRELTRVARRLGYPDRFGLMQHHQAGLVHRWMLPGRTVESVIAAQEVLAHSAELVSAPPRDMARACARFMLPAIVQRQAHDTLGSLATICSLTPAEVVQKHGHVALACVFLRRAVFQSKEGEKLFTAEMQSREAVLVKAVGGPGELSRISGENILLIQTDLVSMASPMSGEDVTAGAVPAAPRIMVSASESHIFMASSFVDGVVETASRTRFWNSDVPLKLLMGVHEALDCARSNRHKATALSGLSAVLHILNDRSLLCVPATFRYAMTLLLRVMQNAELRGTAVGLLDVLVTRAFHQNEGNPVPPLRDLLWPAVTRLVASVSPDAPMTEPCVLLLKKMVAHAPPWLTAAVAALDPFPEGPAFEALRTTHEAMCRELPIEERLVRFCHRARIMPGSTRQSVAIRLLEALRDPKAVEHLHTTPDAPTLAWKLAALSQHVADDAVHELAAACLAAVGVHDPFAVAFHAPATDAFDGVDDEDDARSISARRAVTYEVALASTCLRALCTYMVDTSAAVVRRTLATLRHLLRMTHGALAYKRLSELERSYLCVWSPSASQGATAADDEAARPARLLGPAEPLDSDALWTPPPPEGPHPGRAYARWLCKLTHALVCECDNSTLRMCDNIVQRKAAFAEVLLPHVFADIAAHRGAGATGTPLRQLLSAKMAHCILRNPAAGLRATHLALNVCAHLRSLHVTAGMRGLPLPGKAVDTDPASWSTVHWLDVDYLCVARAAIRVGACMTALQYVEHWCAHGNSTLPLGAGVDALNDAGPLPAQLAVALDAYSAVGEPDGIYGCLNAPHVQLQLQLAEHEGAWGRALAAHDARLLIDTQGEAQGAAAATGALRALLHLGCAHMASTVGATLLGHVRASAGSGVTAANERSFRETQMEMAWRAGQWDIVDGTAPSSGQAVGGDALLSDGNDFHACLASALHALQTGELARCATSLSRGRIGTVRSIALAGSESASAIHSSITRLFMLDEVRDVAVKCWGTLDAGITACATTVNHSIACTLEKQWVETHTRSLGGRFDLMEPLLAARAAAMRAAHSVAGTTHALAAAAAAAHAAGLPAAGLARIQEIKLACAAGRKQGGALESGLAEVAGTSAPWRFDEARLLWANNQPELALVLARALANDQRGGGNAASALTGATVLCTVGRWLASHHGESSARIRSECFDAAIDQLDRASRASGAAGQKEALQAAMCDAHFQLAQFLDNTHRTLGERMIAPEWQQGLRLREQLKRDMDETAAQLAAGRVPAADTNRRIKTLKAQIQADDQQRKSVQEQHMSSLLDCLRAYGQCLATASSHDTVALFRFVALWFKGAGQASVNAIVAEIVRPAAGARGAAAAVVPSAKFLPLVVQLAARLDGSPEADSTQFQMTLHAVVQRLATEHPFHTLNHLLAQQASAKLTDTKAAPTAKVAAAMSVLKHVRAASNRLKVVLSQMEAVSAAYVAIAVHKADAKQHSTTLPPLAQNLKRQLSTRDSPAAVPVITAALPVDPTCAYTPGSFPTFSHFQTNEMHIMGGANQPKRVCVLDSDGTKHWQLAKDRDDLRQDAVMQQVFVHVSALLATAPTARARNLHMHSYRVVPLSPLAGVIEWVMDTTPLGNYLFLGSKSAHQRLRPQDMSYDEARRQLEDARNGPGVGKHARLRSVYDNICSCYQPVLHHFFLENFPTAALWYERRLAYTRSVAVGSMVGYIIGLGDRHSSNILISQKTGELIHIDLGIAFDQGKILPVPELVPFRLTPDIVDGMGASGVDGVMRRCSEVTLSVLRAHKDSVVTLVEVLIHDPILKWAMSPELAARRQQQLADEEMEEEDVAGEAQTAGGVDGAMNVNAVRGADVIQSADAERALWRVRQKLDGVEDGEPRSIDGQVQQLIQDARDPDKLCVMYPGWAPWC